MTPRMNTHKNASLTPKGRAHPVCEIARIGLTPAAEAAGISARTARKWKRRFAAEGAKVAVFDLNLEAAEQVAADIRGALALGERVIVVARNRQRAEEARRLGASEVVVCDARDARDPVLALTGGRGADLVIECTGQVEVWEAAPGLARSMALPGAIKRVRPVTAHERCASTMPTCAQG